MSKKFSKQLGDQERKAFYDQLSKHPKIGNLAFAKVRQPYQSFAVARLLRFEEKRNTPKVRAMKDCEEGFFKKGDIGTLVETWGWKSETYHVHFPEQGVLVCDAEEFEIMEER